MTISTLTTPQFYVLCESGDCQGFAPDPVAAMTNDHYAAGPFVSAARAEEERERFDRSGAEHAHYVTVVFPVANDDGYACDACGGSAADFGNVQRLFPDGDGGFAHRECIDDDLADEASERTIIVDLPSTQIPGADAAHPWDGDPR